MDKNETFRILIIDDNPSIHNDFIKILATTAPSSLVSLSEDLFGEVIEAPSPLLPPFQIDTASQGQEGLERIKKGIKEQKPYSLAFVDIRMPPGWDGVETIKQIWKADTDIQIVICTAFSDYSWEETVENLGKKDNLLILKKPFDTVSVRQLACALTKKWQLMQERKEFTASLVSQIEDKTQQLKHQATHDYLTNLPNRVMLLDKIREAIKWSSENNKIFALLFLDLDRFKLINDSLGHAAGDTLLQEIAARTQTALQAQDILARLGGDEFVILLKDIQSTEEVIAKTNQILSLFQTPYNIEGRPLTITTSIGISLYPRDGNSADVLLRNADTSMYQAKEAGANNFKIYTTEMNKKCLEQLDKEMQIRQGLNNNEFFLVYQPQFDLTSEKLIAVEALIRWRHPQKGLILPMDFIPLTEETGLIIAMGEWALKTACKQNKAWQDAGFDPIRVAINVTAQQLKQANIVTVVKNALTESGLDPKYLELELTENIIVSSAEIVRTIKELKKLGVAIAIDDFGTGYSSLSYLKKLPLDRLKIDGSFIQNIQSELDDEVIIRAIIAVAKNLNLEVLAEGVESHNQLEFLKKQKCDEIQGFYFSKPLSIDDMNKLLVKAKPIPEKVE